VKGAIVTWAIYSCTLPAFHLSNFSFVGQIAKNNEVEVFPELIPQGNISLAYPIESIITVLIQVS